MAKKPDDSLSWGSSLKRLFGGGDEPSTIGQGYEWLRTHTLTGDPVKPDPNVLRDQMRALDKPAAAAPTKPNKQPPRVRNPTTKTTKTIVKSQPQAVVTRQAATSFAGPESNRSSGYTTSASYGRNPKIGKSSAVFGRGNLAAHGATHDTKGLKFFRGKD
jgi:hypothetical protein